MADENNIISLDNVKFEAGEILTANKLNDLINTTKLEILSTKSIIYSKLLSYVKKDDTVSEITETTEDSKIPTIKAIKGYTAPIKEENLEVIYANTFAGLDFLSGEANIYDSDSYGRRYTKTIKLKDNAAYKRVIVAAACSAATGFSKNYTQDFTIEAFGNLNGSVYLRKDIGKIEDTNPRYYRVEFERKNGVWGIFTMPNWVNNRGASTNIATTQSGLYSNKELPGPNPNPENQNDFAFYNTEFLGQNEGIIELALTLRCLPKGDGSYVVNPGSVIVYGIKDDKILPSKKVNITINNKTSEYYPGATVLVNDFYDADTSIPTDAVITILQNKNIAYSNYTTGLYFIAPDEDLTIK